MSNRYTDWSGLANNIYKTPEMLVTARESFPDLWVTVLKDKSGTFYSFCMEPAAPVVLVVPSKKSASLEAAKTSLKRLPYWEVLNSSGYNGPESSHLITRGLARDIEVELVLPQRLGDHLYYTDQDKVAIQRICLWQDGSWRGFLTVGVL